MATESIVNIPFAFPVSVFPTPDPAAVHAANAAAVARVHEAFTSRPFATLST